MNVSDDDSDESDFNPEKDQVGESDELSTGGDDKSTAGTTENTKNPLDSSDDERDNNDNLPEDEPSMSDDSGDSDVNDNRAPVVHATGLEDDDDDDDTMEESTQPLSDMTGASMRDENNDKSLDRDIDNKAVQDVFGDDDEDDGLPDDEPRR